MQSTNMQSTNMQSTNMQSTNMQNPRYHAIKSHPNSLNPKKRARASRNTINPTLPINQDPKERQMKLLTPPTPRASIHHKSHTISPKSHFPPFQPQQATSPKPPSSPSVTVLRPHPKNHHARPPMEVVDESHRRDRSQQEKIVNERSRLERGSSRKRVVQKEGRPERGSLKGKLSRRKVVEGGESSRKRVVQKEGRQREIVKKGNRQKGKSSKREIVKKGNRQKGKSSKREVVKREVGREGSRPERKSSKGES
jgi:hypothetical protein